MPHNRMVYQTHKICLDEGSYTALDIIQQHLESQGLTASVPEAIRYSLINTLHSIREKKV